MLPRVANLLQPKLLRHHVTALLCTLCAFGSSRTAYAAASQLAVAYRAPQSCPNRAEFLRQIELRLSQPSATLVARGAPRFAATVRLQGGAARGTLVVIARDGTRSVRLVPGRSCAEVVAAMALISALTLDPNASTAPLHPATRAQPRNVPARRTHSEPSHAGWHFGLGIRLSVASAVAPHAVLAGEPLITVDDDSGRLLAPEFRLAALRSTTATVTKSLGEATFNWTAARLSVCPVRWPARSALALRPCALMDLGVLEGSGVLTHQPSSAGALWIAPGVAARLSFSPLPPLSFELEGGATFPLERDSFFFAPNTPDNVAFQVPRVGVVASVGVVARLF